MHVPFIPRRPGVPVTRENPGFVNVRTPETFSAQEAPNFSNRDSLQVGVGRDSVHNGSYAQITSNWNPTMAHACAMRPFGDPIRAVRALQTAVVQTGLQRPTVVRKPVNVPDTASIGSQYPLMSQNYYPNLTNLG